MKTPRIVNAIGYIDDELIADAENTGKSKKNLWVKWGSLAACFAVLVIAGAMVLPALFGGKGNTDVEDNRCMDLDISTSESAIVWPWRYRTVYEKYTSVEADGVKYYGKGRAVSEMLVGESIGSVTAAGYDETDDNREYVCEFEGYRLRDIAQSRFIAVKMEGCYYVFKNAEYAPPGTLGELMEAVSLPKVLKLDRFAEGSSTPEGSHFILKSDAYIWEVLNGCRDAAFVEDTMWYVGDRNYISFTVTSEALGIYKVVLNVTEDGYLWTNAFDWQYLFQIGEDAAEKIITYARDNSIKADYEPYQNAVVGTVVEVNEEYCLVDDSCLYKNPENGITYKILLNDIRISRYVEPGVISVGKVVQIVYEGEIDEKNGNVIAGAVSASGAVISDGDVLIPE